MSDGPKPLAAAIRARVLPGESRRTFVVPLAALHGAEALLETHHIRNLLTALGVPGARLAFAVTEAPETIEGARVSAWSDVAVALVHPKASPRSPTTAEATPPRRTPRIVTPPRLGDFRSAEIGVKTLLDTLGRGASRLLATYARLSEGIDKREASSLAASLDALLDTVSLAGEAIADADALARAERAARTARANLLNLSPRPQPARMAALAARIEELAQALAAASLSVRPTAPALALAEVVQPLASILSAIPIPPRSDPGGESLFTLRRELTAPLAMFEAVAEHVTGAGRFVQLLAELDKVQREAVSSLALHAYVRRTAHLLSTALNGGEAAEDGSAARTAWLAERLVDALQARLDPLGEELSIQLRHEQVLDDGRLRLRHPGLNVDADIHLGELLHGSLFVELHGASTERQRYLRKHLAHLEAAATAVGLWTVDVWDVGSGEIAALKERGYSVREPERASAIPRTADLELPKPRTTGTFVLTILEGANAFPPARPPPLGLPARPAETEPWQIVEPLGQWGNAASWKHAGISGMRYLTTHTGTGSSLDLQVLIGPAATEALVGEVERLLTEDRALQEFQAGAPSIKRWIRTRFALFDTSDGPQVGVLFPSVDRAARALEVRAPLRLDPAGRSLTGLARQDLFAPPQPAPLPRPSPAPRAPPAVRRAMQRPVALHPLLARWSRTQSPQDVVRRWTREEVGLLTHLAAGMTDDALFAQEMTTPGALKENTGRIIRKAGVKEVHGAVAMLCAARWVRSGLPKPPSELLDERELQALALAAQGLSFTAMGPALGRLDRHAVSELVNGVVRKLGARTLSQAIAAAYEYELISAPPPAPRPSIETIAPKAQGLLRWFAGEEGELTQPELKLWQNSLRRSVLDELGFDFLWQLAPFLVNTSARALPGDTSAQLDGLDPYARRLVAMLGAGWGFADIGRALGKRRLTIQSEVRALVDRLGLRSELELAVLALRRGIAPMPPQLTTDAESRRVTPRRTDLRRIPARELKPQSIESALWSLAPRERAFIRGTLAGWSGKDVAEALGVSESMIGLIQSAVYTRLGVSSRTEMIAVATKLGLGDGTWAPVERAAQYLATARRFLELRETGASQANLAVALTLPLRELVSLEAWLGLSTDPVLEAEPKSVGRASAWDRIGQAESVLDRLLRGHSLAEAVDALGLSREQADRLLAPLRVGPEVDVRTLDGYEVAYLRLLATDRTVRDIEAELHELTGPTRRRVAIRLGISIAKEGDPGVQAQLTERAVSSGVAWPFIRVPTHSHWTQDLNYSERTALRQLGQGKSYEDIAVALSRGKTAIASLIGGALEKLHLDEPWQGALAVHAEEPVRHRVPAPLLKRWAHLPQRGRDALAALGRGATIEELAVQLGTTIWVAETWLARWRSNIGALNESHAAVLAFDIVRHEATSRS